MLKQADNCLKRKLSFKFTIVIAILSAFFFIHLFSNVIWLKNNSNIGGGDVPSHLFNSLTMTFQIRQAIEKHDVLSLFYQLNSGSIRNDRVHNYEWPRLVYFISAIFNLIFGTSFFTAIMSNMFWFLILILSVYLIGYHLADERAGLLAAFLTSFSPFIWGMSRKYGLDFPLTAMVSLSVYFLIRTEGFKSRFYTILFFSVLGIGFNVKMQVLIFLIAPIFFNIFREEYRGFIINKTKNVILGFIFFLILSSVFWSGYLKEIMYLFFIQQTEGFNDSALTHGASLISSLLFYLHYLLNGLGFLIILFILGVYKLLKTSQKSRFLILSWAIIPIIIFSILDPKQERYILPVFPAFYLIASLGIIYLRNKVLKYSLISLCFMVYIFSYLTISFGSTKYCSVNSDRLGFIGFHEDIHTLPYYNLDNVGKDFSEVIQKHINSNRICKIGILEQSPFFIMDSPLILLCYMKLDLPGRFISMEKDVLMTTKVSNKYFIQKLSSLDFLIVAAKTADDAIDCRNILNADFWKSEILNEEEQYMLKRKLTNFELISKKKACMGQDNFILNLLMRKY